MTPSFLSELWINSRIDWSSLALVRHPVYKVFKTTGSTTGNHSTISQCHDNLHILNVEALKGYNHHLPKGI